MNYKDFYKNKLVKNEEDIPKNIDLKELALGTQIENKHIQNETMAQKLAVSNLKNDPNYYSKLHGIKTDDLRTEDLKNEDGSLKIPRVRGMVGLAKIIQIGKPSDGSCADGATSGYTNVGGHGEDKITAAGKVERDVASHSVGGEVVNGEGQLQGGPNSSGKIEATPKSLEGGHGEGMDQGGPNTKGHIAGTPKMTQEINESKRNLLKAIIQEVLDEITYDEQSKKWKEKSVNEYGYKVGHRSYRTFQDSPQFPDAVHDPEVSEGWAMGEYTPAQEQSINTLFRAGFEEVSSFPSDPDAEGTGQSNNVIVVLQKRTKLGSRQCEVDPEGLCNGQSVEDYLKTLV